MQELQDAVGTLQDDQARLDQALHPPPPVLIDGKTIEELSFENKKLEVAHTELRAQLESANEENQVLRTQLEQAKSQAASDLALSGTLVSKLEEHMSNLQDLKSRQAQAYLVKEAELESAKEENQMVRGELRQARSQAATGLALSETLVSKLEELVSGKHGSKEQLSLLKAHLLVCNESEDRRIDR